MINGIKQSLLFTLANAGITDYLAYSCVLIAFVLLLFIGIFIASKSWWQFGFLFILASFIAFFAGLFYTYDAINSHLRPLNISDINTKQMQYSNTLMLDFNATNPTSKPMRICKITLGFYMSSNKPFKELANSLNPFVSKTIIINDLAPTATREINELVGDFSFSDYKISKKAECF